MWKASQWTYGWYQDSGAWGQWPFLCVGLLVGRLPQEQKQASAAKFQVLREVSSGGGPEVLARGKGLEERLALGQDNSRD